jgi:hypothetical protein
MAHQDYYTLCSPLAQRHFDLQEMRFSDTSLLLVALLASRNSYGFLTTGRASLRSRMFHQLSSLDESANSQNQDNTEENDDRKNYIPKRKDTCKLLISGIIGTDPKEAYLSNDHYVINFALAVVGHYESVHDWEKPKVTFFHPVLFYISL